MFTMEDCVRLGVIQEACEGRRTVESAADALALSERQVYRLKRRVEGLGPEGILHGNRGRRPANAVASDIRDEVIQLYEEEHAEFNFAHYADHLAEEHDVRVSAATVRRWLRGKGLGRPARRQKTHRRRRTRKARFGEMLFLDGSPHPWFGPGSEPCTLVLASDDATGKGLAGVFVAHEDRNSCFDVSHRVFRRWGLPVSWYLDRASQFTTTRHGGTHRRQSDDQPTAFEVAMQTLAVSIIFARSPQARGRAERLNGTFQDRLVVDLRHHGITDRDAATRFLNQSFLPRYARRFAKEPADPTPAWRPVPAGLDLKSVLCAIHSRQVQSDNTFSLHGILYQILPTRHYRHIAHATIQVQERFDDSIHAVHPAHGPLHIEPLP
jgi:transposase